MPAATLQVGTEAGSQRDRSTCLWIRSQAYYDLTGRAPVPPRYAFGSSADTELIHAMHSMCLQSLKVFEKVSKASLFHHCSLEHDASQMSQNYTKLTCCKTDPQDSTSRTLFRRSVLLSCLFFFGSLLPQCDASGFIASRLRDVSSEFFSSVAAAAQFSQTWVTV